MAWVEDLSVFFNEFATSATWTEGSVAVQGIFKMEAVIIEDVQTFKPVLVVPAADVSGVDVGDTFTIDGNAYEVKIIDQTSDATILRLVLESQSLAYPV